MSSVNYQIAIVFMFGLVAAAGEAILSLIDKKTVTGVLRNAACAFGAAATLGLLVVSVMQL